MQRAHLIVHQRNQRRDHDAHPTPGAMPRNRRDLITQRFATARGHQHQRITTAEHLINSFCLPAPKLGVAKHIVQDLRRGIQGKLVEN